MRYALAVLTHGEDNKAKIVETVESFYAMVNWRPVERVVVADGPVEWAPGNDFGFGPWHRIASRTPAGFCTASRMMWNVAANAVRAEYDYVFWLEHDFTFDHGIIDVRSAAAVLDANPMVAQAQWLREPVNDEEREHDGGVVGLHRDRGSTFVTETTRWDEHKAHVWLGHDAYFTTNPCLMRRGFMQLNPWPDYASECEGKFGIDLIRQGYGFAMMEDGLEMCRHTGTRTGHGY